MSDVISDEGSSEGPNLAGDDFSSEDELVSARDDIVSARGTADGLIVRLTADAEPLALQAALRDFLISRSGFLRGAEVFLEWLPENPSEELQDQVQIIMQDEFSVTAKDLPENKRAESERAAAKCVADKRRSKITASGEGEYRVKRGSGRDGDRTGSEEVLSLFDGMSAEDELEDSMLTGEGYGDSLSEQVTMSSGTMSSGSGTSSSVSRVGLDEVCGDEADTRTVFGTLRSGQRVETEHSMVVMGDVNSGAEIVAGGDIIVLGKLRGVAHAGAYDETGGGKVIVAVDLSPTQLRIGSVITRGSADSKSRKNVEIARVEGNLIVVELYRSRDRLR